MKTPWIFSALLLSAAPLWALENNVLLPTPNPNLAAEESAIMHVNSAATDSYTYPIPLGVFHVDLANTPQVVGGPVNIMTLRSPSADYMWGVSSGGVTYINKAGNNWKEVARFVVPGILPTTKELNEEALGHPLKTVQDVEKSVTQIYKMKGFERIANGVYSLVDKNNVLYANYNNSIYAFTLIEPSDPSKGIVISHTLNYSQISKIANERVAGVSMTYDGFIIIVGNRSISIVDRNLEKIISRVEFNANEYISNSIAVDENNGIYVASDKWMRKLIWNGKSISTKEEDGAWSAAYNIGEQPPIVKVGIGTGSTPTLMGFGTDSDKLVVITDGSNHMNLVAFWRDTIPADFKQRPNTKSRRIADQIGVTCGFYFLPQFIQSEQSVVVKGYGAFVVNNIGSKGHKDLLVGVIGLGPVFPPPRGVERFEWDVQKHQWHSVWANSHAVSTSMVPVVSIPSNVVLINGYTKDNGWEITGLDWNSGKVMHQTIFGQSNYGNGAYAIIELLPDNNLIFNSIAGPYRINYNALK